MTESQPRYDELRAAFQALMDGQEQQRRRTAERQAAEEQARLLQEQARRLEEQQRLERIAETKSLVEQHWPLVRDGVSEFLTALNEHVFQDRGTITPWHRVTRGETETEVIESVFRRKGIGRADRDYSDDETPGSVKPGSKREVIEKTSLQVRNLSGRQIMKFSFQVIWGELDAQERILKKSPFLLEQDVYTAIRNLSKEPPHMQWSYDLTADPQETIALVRETVLDTISDRLQEAASN